MEQENTGYIVNITRLNNNVLLQHCKKRDVFKWTQHVVNKTLIFCKHVIFNTSTHVRQNCEQSLVATGESDSHPKNSQEYWLKIILELLHSCDDTIHNHYVIFLLIWLMVLSFTQEKRFNDVSWIYGSVFIGLLQMSLCQSLLDMRHCH